jgi:hypothetical protein
MPQTAHINHRFQVELPSQFKTFPPMSTDLRETIAARLAAFAPPPAATPVAPAPSFRDTALDFFRALGYASARTLDTGGSPDAFRSHFDPDHHHLAPANTPASDARFSEWRSAHLLFQLTDDELSAERPLFGPATTIERARYNSYIFLAIELSAADYPRAALAAITRRLNRIFPQPVMVLFKVGGASRSPLLSLAVINRRPSKLDSARDVLGKVSLIRDISPAAPHRGHLDILASLAVPNLSNSAHGTRAPITTFDTLHAAWERLFNVQLLNKSFYNRLVTWYSQCLTDIQINLTAASRILAKDIDNELKPQAVIRVIIRLLFIWFMKQKGLLSDHLLTREFATEFVKKPNGYYNAILQNLFFAVLNKQIAERRFRREDKTQPFNPETNDYGIADTLRHRAFFHTNKADAFLAATRTIPYVNGGLFVCHDYKFSGTDAATNARNTKQNYNIDGFSDNPRDRATISDATIFALIDLFNDFVFTIEEATPTEQEIALDPELLGTVFENLIGAYNPETKENARKQTGSFYTPREIVDYMCRESLKQRLITSLSTSTQATSAATPSPLATQITTLIDNHEDQLNFPEKTAITNAITHLKILDPACGSGAFPMGMFLLMVRTIEKLQEHKTTYKNKLDIITNCIYGIDIQNIAIEITKLRFFISLLVDYPTPKKPENFEVLPNLETKFVVANTLVGAELPQQHDLFRADIAFEELTRIFLPFTVAKTPKEKEKIKNAFTNKKEEIINNPNFELGADIKEKIRQWNPFNICYCSPFFDSGIMFGITKGFDIVIGNPPYVRADEQSEWNRHQREQILSSAQYETLWEKWDIFVPFLERGYKLLCDGGICALIVSDAYCHSKYAQKSQNWFLKHARIHRLDFCGDLKIFDAAVHNVIPFFQKPLSSPVDGVHAVKSSSSASIHADRASALADSSPALHVPERRLHKETFGNITLLPTDKQQNLTHRAFFPNENETATNAFFIETMLLSDICYISKGMVVHADEKTVKGAFELDDLVSDKKDKTHPCRFVEGKHLARWLPSENKWLEWGTERAPTQFSRPTFPKLYTVPEKLISVDMSAGTSTLKVAYDDQQLFHNHSAWSFVPWHSLDGVRNNSLKKAARYDGEKPLRPDLPRREALEEKSRRYDIKYLLGVMNSATARDYLRAHRRSNIHLYPDDWKKLPIPAIPLEAQAPIAALVDRILTAKRAALSNPELGVHADTAALESEIDTLVYSLYNLTPAEIQTIETKQ